jgi:predicted TIM-barrel fold metal-dependent hydrolase
MLFDTHVHLSDPKMSRIEGRGSANVLLISRSLAENHACLDFSNSIGAPCAVFIGHNFAERMEAAQLMRENHAIGYDHLEAVGRFSKELVRIIFAASRESRSPVILHLSRHDGGEFPLIEARRCLDYVSEHFPAQKVVISHLGGENCREVSDFAIRNPNIFLDTSCLSETTLRIGTKDPIDTLKFVAERVPAAQLVFGSDQFWPTNYENCVELESVKQVFAPRELKSVLVDNALSVFGSFGFQEERNGSSDGTCGENHA